MVILVVRNKTLFSGIYRLYDRAYLKNHLLLRMIFFRLFGEIDGFSFETPSHVAMKMGHSIEI